MTAQLMSQNLPIVSGPVGVFCVLRHPNHFVLAGANNRNVGWFRKRRPKHEAPKTRKRSTLSRKRSTQNSKTKTPKSRKRSTLDRKRSIQKLETGLPFINTRPMLIQQESSTITNRTVLLFSTIEPGPRLLP